MAEQSRACGTVGYFAALLVSRFHAGVRSSNEITCNMQRTEGKELACIAEKEGRARRPFTSGRSWLTTGRIAPFLLFARKVLHGTRGAATLGAVCAQSLVLLSDSRLGTRHAWHMSRDSGRPAWLARTRTAGPAISRMALRVYPRRRTSTARPEMSGVFDRGRCYGPEKWNNSPWAAAGLFLALLHCERSSLGPVIFLFQSTNLCFVSWTTFRHCLSTTGPRVVLLANSRDLPRGTAISVLPTRACKAE